MSVRESMGFSASTDPELEFDREVYPIGISLAEVAVVGAAPSPLFSTSSYFNHHHLGLSTTRVSFPLQEWVSETLSRTLKP